MDYHEEAMQTLRFRQNYNQPFRLMISITTILSIFCDFKRHLFKRRWENSRDNQPTHHIYRKVCRRFQFIAEILILMAVPIPFYEKFIFDMAHNPFADTSETVIIPQFLSDFILVIMFFRLYFVVRSISN